MTKEAIKDEDPRNLRENGSKQLGLDGFFEYLELEDNPKVAGYVSPISEALGTSYNLVLQAPLLHMVWAKDGLVLGKIGGEDPFRFRPSISVVPTGEGKIVIFGFFLMQSLASNGPEFAAWDLAQILSCGVLQMDSASAMWHQDHRLSRGETTTGLSSLTVPSGVVGLVIFEYTHKESDGVLFYRDFVNVTDIEEHSLSPLFTS